MSNFRGMELSRQGIFKNSRDGKSSQLDKDVIYLIQAFNDITVRTYRTENPAKAMTICKPYVKRANTVQISAWIRVGDCYMIPMTYVACSQRDLANAFESMTRDIACAMKSSQLDEEREEQKELARQEIPSFNSFPEFMCESGEALER